MSERSGQEIATLDNSFFYFCPSLFSSPSDKNTRWKNIEYVVKSGMAKIGETPISTQNGIIESVGKFGNYKFRDFNHKIQINIILFVKY